MTSSSSHSQSTTPSRSFVPTFSVVTPSYNQGAYLEETIKSVLAQKGAFHIDYIIVDGGSTDHSLSIIKKYDDIMKNRQWPVQCLGVSYRWLSEPDEGQSDAIEKGFSMATGDIGVWLNSDDLFYDDKVFQTVADYFERCNVELVVGNGINIDQTGKKIGAYQTKRIDLKELIFLDYHILQPAAFLKTGYYRSFGFDRTLFYTFDVDFFVRLLKAGVRYRKVPEFLACNRLHPESKSVSGMGRLVKEFMIVQGKCSRNPLYRGISWFYKYFSVIAHYRLRNVSAFWNAYRFTRNLCYFIIIGTWGRK
jgi:glycosyltransferase involved in cell wall biosynthesis